MFVFFFFSFRSPQPVVENMFERASSFNRLHTQVNLSAEKRFNTLHSNVFAIYQRYVERLKLMLATYSHNSQPRDSGDEVYDVWAIYHLGYLITPGSTWDWVKCSWLTTFWCGLMRSSLIVRVATYYARWVVGWILSAVFSISLGALRLQTLIVDMTINPFLVIRVLVLGF